MISRCAARSMAKRIEGKSPIAYCLAAALVRRVRSFMTRNSQKRRTSAAAKPKNHAIVSIASAALILFFDLCAGINVLTSNCKQAPISIATKTQINPPAIACRAASRDSGEMCRVGRFDSASGAFCRCTSMLNIPPQQADADRAADRAEELDAAGDDAALLPGDGVLRRQQVAHRRRAEAQAGDRQHAGQHPARRDPGSHRSTARETQRRSASQPSSAVLRKPQRTTSGAATMPLSAQVSMTGVTTLAAAAAPPPRPPWT